MKILAVDDDPIFLSILEEMLHGFGKTDLTLAYSAAEAFEALQLAETPFDCILLDIQMPLMNGLELCGHIRRMQTYKRTPIVMVTTMGDRSSIDAAFAEGATDYINKPLERFDLKARIGMVERLLAERERATILELQMSARSTSAMPSVQFEEAFMIPEFDRGIELVALENYLLTIGRKKMHATSAIGISVQNAASFFRKTSSANFVNMLGDVAAAISDAFKTQQVMIAYAGEGNFICVSDASMSIDMDQLELEIQLSVDEFEAIYAMDNLPPPRISIGKSTRGSFFSLMNPTSLIDRAIAQTAGSRSQKSATWWVAA